MTDLEELNYARALWSAAEKACELGTKPFFDDGLILTEERKKDVKKLFEHRNIARDRYDKALRENGWPVPPSN